MNWKRHLFNPVILATLAFTVGGWMQLQQADASPSDFDERLFAEVMERLGRDYVDPYSRDDLYKMAVDGVLQEIGDPHTSYMSAEEYAELRVQTQGEYGGLGIQIAERSGWVTIIATLPGTPAERAGLRPGDRIVSVNGESTKGWKDDDMVKVLRGPQGSSVNIEVARLGIGEPIPYTIERAEIHVRSVRHAYMAEPGIGLIRLDVFSGTSTQELVSAIERLRREGMQSLVLDMRSNPGGLLDQGIAISDIFLPEGDRIVETRGRRSNEIERFTARDPDHYPELAIVVLLDEYSASAAEIVAGALQDHDRAVVVGRTSFGKGSVQSLFPLSSGDFLKMTTARWYTPSGRSIQKEEKEEDTISPLASVQASGASGTEDTANREQYRTDAGRVVFGGGGIVPDMLISADTLDTAEKIFAEAVARGGSTFGDVIYSYSLEYAQQHPDLSPSFTITEEMLGEVYRRLTSGGIIITRSEFDAAAEPVRNRLIFEIAQNAFGPAQAAERSNLNDPSVSAAISLLRGVESPQALFQKLQVQQSAQR